MNEDRSSISNADSYQAIGEFWEQTKPAEFEVDIRPEVIYYAVEADLSQKVRSLAEQRGVSAETLLNLWVQEKVMEAVAAD